MRDNEDYLAGYEAGLEQGRREATGLTQIIRERDAWEKYAEQLEQEIDGMNPFRLTRIRKQYRPDESR